MRMTDVQTIMLAVISAIDLALIYVCYLLAARVGEGRDPAAGRSVSEMLIVSCPFVVVAALIAAWAAPWPITTPARRILLALLAIAMLFVSVSFTFEPSR